MLGTPPLKDFKAIIQMNYIKNNPITLEDIKLAENIFGPDIGSLKGKTTRKKPLPVVSDYIEIPHELLEAQRDITLCMDTMRINGISFLTIISQNIMYPTTEWIPNQTSKSYRSALDNVFRLYNLAGFNIKYIHCDNEYQSLMNELQEAYNVRMNYANAQEHVPEIERSIRVIKERFRATFHQLPFLKLPAVMVKILAMESTKKLNFFPPTNGMSPYYSPRMITHQENLDYAKHCAILFGTYVQAHTEPMRTNTQHPRTLDCIYLQYLSNKQGGHELLDLRTGAMITRQNVSPLPMTQDVIDLVHAMADRDNMPTGLKITTKAGIVLHDTASIAGVYGHSEINEEEDGFDDEMNPNDIGEILPDKKNTLEFTVLENDDYEEASINNDNNNSNDSENKDEEDNVTESGSNQDSSDENNDQGDQGNPTPYTTTRFGRVSNPL